VKWLTRITLLDRPFEGFYMDNVYRIFQKEQDPKVGEAVTRIPLKCIITQPLADEKLPAGPVVILGAAYGGEAAVERVEVSADGGRTWRQASFTGPNEPYAWRQWQYIWDVCDPGTYTLMARATDSHGFQQPESASWNVLGYGNNGVQEHAVKMEIV
jgi:DMSO/TMAO reductase YedYZ molybdopterin-dependent catalytic subunit